MSVMWPVEFQKQLEDLANVDDYAPIMLNEAAPILLNSVKRALTAVTSDEASGEMIKSIKVTKASRYKNGAFYVQARPTGTDKNRKGGGYLRKGKRGELIRRGGSEKYWLIAGSQKVEGGTRDNIRNAEKAMYLQYGTSRGQPPRPWLERSASSAETQVIEKMTEVFYREALKE